MNVCSGCEDVKIFLLSDIVKEDEILYAQCVECGKIHLAKEKEVV